MSAAERVSALPARGARQTSASAAEAVAARSLHMMGAHARDAWAADEAMAWEGLLEVARRLRRGAEELLLERYELGVSMLGVTGRLALADDHTLRQTALAEAMGLSLSRVSRVIDLLEQRALVVRGTCPSDARATNVTLTREGAAVTARAQRDLFAFVRDAFVACATPAELHTLAGVFARIIEGAQRPARGRAG